jgi:hypothetical protein
MRALVLVLGLHSVRRFLYLTRLLPYEAGQILPVQECILHWLHNALNYSTEQASAN